MLWITVLPILFCVSHAEIIDDYNCTEYDSTQQFAIYERVATSCENVMSDEICEVLFPKISPSGWPTTGGTQARPYNCYSTDVQPGKPIDSAQQAFAISFCPKTCGYCCRTNAFAACKNPPSPRLDCNLITPAQCADSTWRAILLSECPSTCGLCGELTCIDKISVCNVDWCNQSNSNGDFAAENCKKTCGKCGGVVADPCLNGYPADTNSSCKVWAEQGFCTSPFYTLAQKKQYCSTTCKIC